MAGYKSLQRLGVEAFWKNKFLSISFEEAERICKAYQRHLVGTEDYHKMGLVHACINPAKED